MKIFAKKLCALLLLVSVVLPLFPALPIAASDINETALPDFLWELDFEKMNNQTDNGGSKEFSLTGQNVFLTTAHEKKALSIVNANGAYFIEDTNKILDDYETFFIEADMYFESYPVGSSSNGSTAREYPMSFVTWITKRQDGGESYRSIRVDHEGYLCTGSDPINKPQQKSDAKLPLGEWFNIRFIVNPATGLCEVCINGESLLTYSIGACQDLAGSRIRFFDTRYQYSVHFSNISVYSDSAYRIGLIKEDAADYLGYQTTKINGQSFDLRVISAMNVDNIKDYSETGVVVTTLWQEDGVRVEKETYYNSKTVYESLLASGKKVSAEELGASSVAAIPIKGLPTDKGALEIAIRPYAKKDGMSFYGEAVLLLWSGEIKDGYPHLSIAERTSEDIALPSDDTYVRQTTDENFGTQVGFEMKNSGSNTPYTREVYVKFNFTDSAVETLLAAGNIYFEFYVRTHRQALTEEEIAEGGILAGITGVEADWTETTLTGKNADTLAAEIEHVGNVRYTSGQYTRIDVTDYIRKYAAEGSVAFRIENVNPDGESGQMRLNSRESEYGTPRLVICPVKYNHELNLGKMNNRGYEPWGYAEQLVNEWFSGVRDQLYAKTYDTADLIPVNNSTASGDYTIPTVYGEKNIYARTVDTLTGFTPSAASQYDVYGGITNSGIQGTATGFFHTETIENHTYIIDPLGNPFFAAGINTAELGSTNNQKQASLEKYGSAENFYTQVSATLRQVGLNTYWGGDIEFSKTNQLAAAVSLRCIGGYMNQSLGLGASSGGSAKYKNNNTMNVFDPDFIAYCNTTVAATTKDYIGNPYVLGFYSDNELPADVDMLTRYLSLDPEDPINAFSYAAAWTWLIRATGKANPSAQDATPALYEEFKAFVYYQYFKTVTDAIESAGGGDYMYLGCRAHNHNETSEGYLRAAGHFVDVLSVNLYGGVEPPVDTMELLYRYTGKPFIVTEFFAKAGDAKDMNGYTLGNQSNAGWYTTTQKDRAVHFENYVLLLLESGHCVGWTWYRFRDNDQTLYADPSGNLYRAYDFKNGEISAYTNVVTGETIEGAKIASSLTIYYKGESDTSNLGSNKGIFDNKMNLYKELTDAMKNISDNVFSLLRYFDEIHK